jgi:cell division protein FtsB
MPLSVVIVALVSILCVFGSQVAVTWMKLKSRRLQVDASAEELAALRSAVDELREQMASNQADVTLMLDDIARKALAPRDPQ